MTILIPVCLEIFRRWLASPSGSMADQSGKFENETIARGSEDVRDKLFIICGVLEDGKNWSRVIVGPILT